MAQGPGGLHRIRLPAAQARNTWAVVHEYGHHIFFTQRGDFADWRASLQADLERWRAQNPDVNPMEHFISMDQTEARSREGHLRNRPVDHGLRAAHERAVRALRRRAALPARGGFHRWVRDLLCGVRPDRAGQRALTSGASPFNIERTEDENMCQTCSPFGDGPPAAYLWDLVDPGRAREERTVRSDRTLYDNVPF